MEPAKTFDITEDTALPNLVFLKSGKCEYKATSNIKDTPVVVSFFKEKNKLPKVLIPVHLAGNPCDMKEIWELSQTFGFKIIEDASHAIGSTYHSNPIGNCQFSDITVFSFHPVKIITSGEGGIATTNQESLFRSWLLYTSDAADE